MDIKLPNKVGNTRYALTLSAAALLFVVCSPQVALAAGNTAYCSTTAKFAYKACQHDTRDDYLIAQGTCINISDVEDRAECKDEAKAELAETNELCRDQKDARLDICDSLGEARYDPVIDPDDFVDPLQIGGSIAANTFLPLTPSTRVYEDGDETITITISDETVEILGVTCLAVRDVVEEDGVIIEDTVDWFAQDTAGNVWYFGEFVLNYEDGKLSDLDGSWEAGVDGAKPGILMPANPVVGEIYRQEWLLGEAEDMGEVLSVTASESSNGGEFDCAGTCVQTLDFIPLEPDVFEHKFYAPGIGLVVAFHTDEPEAREELVEISFP